MNSNIPDFFLNKNSVNYGLLKVLRGYEWSQNFFYFLPTYGVKWMKNRNIIS